MPTNSPETQTFVLEVKLSIDSSSRAIVDREMEHVRHCIIPLVGEYHQRPYLAGSALALRYGGASFLATAQHVLENAAGALAYFGSDRWTRPFGGQFRVAEEADLAVKLLGKDDIEALAHVPFLGEEAFASEEDLAGRFYASVAGYPATAAKRHDKTTLETPVEVMSHFGTLEADGTISVAFDKKEGARGTTGHIDPRNPYGKSGGAIFAMRAAGPVVLPGQSAKLAGISLEWQKREKRIIGAGIFALKKLLDSAIATVGDDGADDGEG